MERMEIGGGSTSASACSSYHQSPCASYNPSPGSSSFPSPASSSYVTNPISTADGNSLIPWLKNLSSASSKPPNNFYIHSGSISAPVTPPFSSPDCRSPRIQMEWDDQAAGPAWGGHRFSYLPSSTPPSPGRQVLPTSPTFSLVASNPFSFKDDTSAGCSRMWTPGQSGTCSPAVAGPSDNTADIPMADGFADEFAFGSNIAGLVKPWEGERIHEESADDLELTLGSSRTRYVNCYLYRVYHVN